MWQYHRAGVDRSLALVYAWTAAGAAFVTHHLPPAYFEWFDGAVVLDGQVLRDVLTIATVAGLDIRFVPAIGYTG